MNQYKIAVIEGDGIGREVVPEGLRVLEAAGRRYDIAFSWNHFDWSCQTYLKTGQSGFPLWEPICGIASDFPTSSTIRFSGWALPTQEVP